MQKNFFIKIFKWIYSRIGQMTCFGSGSIMIFNARDSAFTDLMALTLTLGGIGLMFTGLGLKAIYAWKTR